MSLKVNNVPKDNLLDSSIVTLKEKIHHKLCIFKPKLLEEYFNVKKKVESNNMTPGRVATNHYRENHVSSPNLTQTTRLTAQQMAETREKGLCFNYDKKYNKGHKCDQMK